MMPSCDNFGNFIIAVEAENRDIPVIQIDNMYPQKSRLKIMVVSADTAKIFIHF
jgi:hypothetical protein